ncbi:hypothetical protein [Streptomyces clavuligerus]|uniref:Uncharacterized protein n=1 Tax=Streptomyces clavuligerus TaxID=1901 RepID=B5GP67_STRCL|nr:hypothetical protein [Streptomyces clavuligerus]ANW21915.1 hypothetical protein BB341_12690 [Streptomyces clavuligerus]AXU16545.1 hypothetical protein D1794_13155 [Streptomyces clavuligerus]EDY48114.1 hypothetical protein SSCG_01141 [Streptomyces clavuligerus]EFG08252.1 Hypothetical protein SCLAV_3181 [Streptomyces clavuligerus]QCS09308.1 hypothetical protein CRV15_12590 [Streptomyces clavuligerus]
MCAIRCSFPGPSWGCPSLGAGSVRSSTPTGPRRRATALRARRPEADHLYGTVYRLTPGGPVATRNTHTARAARHTSWFRAAHLAVTLNGVTPVRLTRPR